MDRTFSFTRPTDFFDGFAARYQWPSLGYRSGPKV